MFDKRRKCWEIVDGGVSEINNEQSYTNEQIIG